MRKKGRERSAMAQAPADDKAGAGAGMLPASIIHGEFKGGVAAVDRALTILDAFREGDASLTLTELSKRTGFYKSTTMRLAESLERFGYLRRLEGGNYVLGPKPLHLGALYQKQFRTADYVPAALRAVVDELGEGASFFIRDNDRRICLHRADSARAVRDAVKEGDVLPLHVGASGHVLLAFNGLAGEKYDTIRRRLYSASAGERDAETDAVACPVLGVGDKIVGALSVSGPKYRMEKLPLEKVLPVLFRHAQSLTRCFGGDAETFARAR